ncbi:hypothetical protein [Streptomyces sp. NPDC047981]
MQAHPDVKAVDVECISHTGRTGHGIFARTFQDVAVVVKGS